MTHKQALEWLTEARAALLLTPTDVTIKMPGRPSFSGPDFWSVFNAIKKHDESLATLGYERDKLKVIYIKEKTK